MKTEHREVTVSLAIELCNRDGSWRARVAHPLLVDLAVEGRTRKEALLKAQAAALRMLADQTDREPDERCRTTIVPYDCVQ